MNNCINCSYCIGCCNLNGKNFCIFNEQKTESEYQDTLSKIKKDANFRNIFFAEYSRLLGQRLIQRENSNLASENVFGDFVYNSKNTSGYDLRDCADCKNCYDTISSQDCYDLSHW